MNFYYELMHKDVPVLTISATAYDRTLLGGPSVSLGADTNSSIYMGFNIESVDSILNEAHIPIGYNATAPSIKEWFYSRCVPTHRYNIEDIKYRLGVDAMEDLLFYSCASERHSFALSLSDQYWLKPIGMNVNWKDINFFDNPWNESVGKVLSYEAVSIERSEFDSNNPDITTDAFLPKRWIRKEIEGDKYQTFLLKGFYSGFEPYNEVIATRLMEHLGINHVSYTFEKIYSAEGARDYPYSVCLNMVTPDTELIPIYALLRSDIPDVLKGNISLYDLCVKKCSEVGVDAVPFLNQMLVVDFLICNEDRHLRNFGLLRDANTLKFIGMAPIFDTGTSMGCLWGDSSYIRKYAPLKSRPFKENHHEQIKLVTDFSWLDMKNLTNFEDEICHIYSQKPIENYLKDTFVGLWQDRYLELQKILDTRC